LYQRGKGGNHLSAKKIRAGAIPALLLPDLLKEYPGQVFSPLQHFKTLPPTGTIKNIKGAGRGQAPFSAITIGNC
jgi:hypothetical protein